MYSGKVSLLLPPYADGSFVSESTSNRTISSPYTINTPLNSKKFRSNRYRKNTKFWKKILWFQGEDLIMVVTTDLGLLNFKLVYRSPPAHQHLSENIGRNAGFKIFCTWLEITWKYSVVDICWDANTVHRYESRYFLLASIKKVR